jgi:hypothetical protein
MEAGDAATQTINAERMKGGNEAGSSNVEQHGENTVGSPSLDMGTLQSALSEVSGEAEK